jgi:glycosyltransferase involved in cell wall biosynthesis
MADRAATRVENRALWISWLHQRRTSELARAMNLPLYTFAFTGARPVRHLRAILSTVALLVRTRPALVLVQNPSIMLAALACTLRPLLGFKVVVDRHSNFDFSNTTTGVFNRISTYSLARANLTIVTNDAVRQIVERAGGRAFVLQDKLPDIPQAPPTKLQGQFNVLFVCSFSKDEPVDSVLEAARLLSPDVCIYVTGNNLKLDPAEQSKASANVVFTGFLPVEQYDGLLRSCDVVLSLTTRQHTLTSGAYEALGADKPLVLSSTDALTAYFRSAAVRTGSSGPEIAEAISTARAHISELRAQVAPFKAELIADWTRRFDDLQARLSRLMGSG